MIFDLISGGLENALIQLLLFVPIALLALTFHEFAHGFVANKLGDPTAKNLGRLSLNPVKHLDLMGTLMILIVGIGWAKPVPINSRYFKRPKRDMALTALAGPLMNLIIAFVGVTLYSLFIRFFPLRILSGIQFSVISAFFYILSYLNCYFALFNLLPIPPFDGSRIAFVLLPDKFYWGVMKHERVIMMVTLLAIILLSGTGYNPLSMASEWIISQIQKLYFMILF